MAKAGRNPDKLVRHVLCIGGATTLAAGGETPERAVQSEGSGSPMGKRRTYTGNNIEGSQRVSRTLVIADEGKERQPGEGTARGRKLQLTTNSSLT